MRKQPGGCISARLLPFFADKVDEVVDVEDVAAGKYAGNAGLEVFRDQGALRSPAHGDAGAFRQFVLRDEAGGNEEGVTGNLKLSAGDETATLVDFSDEDRGDTFFAADFGDDGIVVDRDVKVLDALLHVAGQAAGVGHDLHDSRDFAALQDELAGHDQADVAGADDDDAAAGQVTVDIEVALGSAGSHDARAAGTGNEEGVAAALTAAHGEDDGLCPDLHESLFRTHGSDGPVRVQFDHEGVQEIRNPQLLHHIRVSGGKFHAGQILFEAVQAESVMNALLQDSAQGRVPLQDQDIPHTVFICADSGRHSRGPAADDDKFHFFHASTPRRGATNHL